MSEIIVSDIDKHLEFEILNVLIDDDCFYLEILMFNIKKYNDAIEGCIFNNKDYNFLYEEFIDVVEKFKNKASELETNLTRYIDLERELNMPTRFEYRKLLKSLKSNPIPTLFKP